MICNYCKKDRQIKFFGFKNEKRRRTCCDCVEKTRVANARRLQKEQKELLEILAMSEEIELGFVRTDELDWQSYCQPHKRHQ